MVANAESEARGDLPEWWDAWSQRERECWEEAEAAAEAAQAAFAALRAAGADWKLLDALDVAKNGVTEARQRLIIARLTRLLPHYADLLHFAHPLCYETHRQMWHQGNEEFGSE